jgi:L-2,4-diaminobutyric acid acetyltransferase
MQYPIDPMRIDLPSIRKPVAEDGAKVWELVQACKPLDENSMYCNLLQSDHFADTCCLAELSQETVGWVSAYVLPNDPETLFDAAIHSAAPSMQSGKPPANHNHR